MHRVVTAYLPRIAVEATESPAEGSGPASILWMHGLGADGTDFVPIVPHLRMPHARFVFPNAPHQPVTINGGVVMPSWYDILSLAPGADREDETQVRKSAEQLEALIERERARGVPAHRIVVAGFSQGGAMAFHLGTRYGETLAGIMVLSAYQLLPGTYGAERSPANIKTPALCCHGTGDEMVGVDRGEAAHKVLDTDGREAEWHTFPMGHEVCMEELDVIRAWLHKVLPA